MQSWIIEFMLHYMIQVMLYKEWVIDLFQYVHLCASSTVSWHIAQSILVSVYSGAENGSMAGYSEAMVKSSSNLEVSLFVMVCHNCAMEFAQEFVFGQHIIHFFLTFLEYNVQLYLSTYGLFSLLFPLSVIFLNFLKI